MTTNPISFNCSLAELRAMNVFRSTDETRYVLCGIYVEVGLDHEALLVATDGRSMAILRPEWHNEPAKETGGCIISGAALDTWLAAARDLEGDTICHIQCEDDIAAITIPGGIAVEITGGLIDGNYPNWVQIVPGISAMTPAKELRLSPRFISRFRKAAKLLNIENSMHLCFSGDEGTVQIRFHRSPGFYGLLMPIRLELDDRKLSEHPDWLIKRLSVKSMVEKEAA